MTQAEWEAELETPFYEKKGRVSPKVAQEELAAFKRAQAVLQSD